MEHFEAAYESLSSGDPEEAVTHFIRGLADFLVELDAYVEDGWVTAKRARERLKRAAKNMARVM